MNGLTEIEERVYELHHNQGLKYREFIDDLSITYDQARHAFSRAKRKYELSESPGVDLACEELGIDGMVLQGGWLKSKEASLRFKVKDTEDADNVDNFIEIVKDAFSELERFEPTQIPEYTRKELLTKYILTDLHMGLHAYAEETGGEDYDLKIAEEVLMESMEHLVSTTPNSRTGMIMNLGDIFHANDSKNMTPLSGHILDMDGRFAKIAVITLKAIRYVIDRALEKHEKVIFANIPGNHDRDQAHWLAIALMAAYENEPRVEIKWTPAFWFMHQHGRNLIVAHHGDRTNFNRLVLAMADNYPEEWGSTYWRFLDTGHVHHQREQEIGGVLCRSYRTLAAKDAYSAHGGYTSRRSMVAQTLHETKGEIITNQVHLFQGKVA